MFADQSRKPGQHLRQFTILRESAGVEGYRCFEVKLALQEPDESILAKYYVFGQGPIWVYRAEDFEMMMHMEPMIDTAAPQPKNRSKAESERHNHVSPSKASEASTGPSLSP
jgi:hypothetical protein